MKGTIRALIFFLCLIGRQNFSIPQSVQDLGFPNPAVVEVVLPYVAFGTTQVGKLVTEIVVNNSSQKDAFVEIDLLDPGGQRPSLRFEGVIGSAFNGRLISLVSANSIRRFSYPWDISLSLVGPAFTGWVTLRSNGNVTVYQSLKVLDPSTNEVLSGVDFPGNLHPLVTAQFTALLNGNLRTGFAVANPSQLNTLRLRVQRLDSNGAVAQEKIIEQPPRAQRSLIADDFFQARVYGYPGSLVRLVPISSTDTFALTVVHFYVDLIRGRPDVLRLFLPETINRLTGEKIFSVEMASGTWNFPVNVTATARFRDLQILLTSLAFFLKADDGSRLGPFLVLEPDPRIVVNQDAGIAVVAGPNQNFPFEKPIIFAKQRAVIYERMHGEVEHIIDFPEKGQAEIKTIGLVDFGAAIASVSTFLLLDKEKGQVIARFVGSPLDVPPWRQNRINN